jgi:hypothetical protein
MSFISQQVYCFREKSENFFNIVEYFAGNNSDLFKLFGVDEEETLRNIRGSKIPDQSKNYLYSFSQGIHLAQELRDFGCDSIEKFSETPDWKKFLSLKSELLFANAFAKLGFSVSLISDSSQEWRRNGQMLPSPDILLEKDGQKFFVEVARISNDETVSKVLNKLNELNPCSQYMHNLYVWIKFSTEFSSPAISHVERTERDELINRFVDEFQEFFPLINRSSMPETIEIQNCQVEFSAQPHFSYRRIDGIPSTIIIPQCKLNQQVKIELERKAKKREKWTDLHKTYPYFVALDIRLECQFQFALINLLFGESSYYDALLKLPEYCEPPLVSQAKTRGWSQFLESVGYKPQPQSRIISPGILISDPCIFQNVTGIVVNIWDSLQSVPNPFAEEQINRPDFQEIIKWPLLPEDDLIYPLD